MEFSRKLFKKLFSIFSCGEKEIPPTPTCSKNTKSNRIHGEILNSGAGEFLAQTPLGIIHGTLHGVPADEDVPAGTNIEISIPPELIDISDCPPEENFFKLEEENAGTISQLENGNWSRSWKLQSGNVLQIISTSREKLELNEDAFAWILPEDVAAFPLT